MFFIFSPLLNLLLVSMESIVYSPPKDSLITVTRNSRAKPLYTMGVSFLSIVHRAYNKAEVSLGPIAYITQTLAKVVSPIVYSLQYQWLAMLSYTDEQILAIENLVEAIFPSSAFMFDKIDSLVHIAAALLLKCENAVDDFPYTLHQMQQVLLSILNNAEFVEGKDKGVTTDIDPSALPTALVEYQGKVKCDDRPVSGANEIEVVKPKSMDKAPPIDITEIASPSANMNMNLERGRENEKVQENPILDLFEEGWYMR